MYVYDLLTSLLGGRCFFRGCEHAASSVWGKVILILRAALVPLGAMREETNEWKTRRRCFHCGTRIFLFVIAEHSHSFFGLRYVCVCEGRFRSTSSAKVGRKLAGDFGRQQGRREKAGRGRGLLS